MRGAISHIAALLAAALIIALPATASAQRSEAAADKLLRVQLKWKHQFQFAGYYAAELKGFFRDAGLNVQLIEGGPTIDPAQAVVSGKAEFGVGNSTLIIDRAAGKPVVAVAAFFQRSPFVILARRDRNLASVLSLEGRTLMVEEHAAEVMAYLRLAGVDLNKIRMVPHTGDVRDMAADNPSGIDATTAYTSTEPYYAIRANIPVRIFDPRDIGIDFYGDTLFTTDGFAAERPDDVRAMKKAVIRGWEYALANQDEVITYILERYAPEDDRVRLGFEAQATKDLVAKDLADVGYMSTSRWKHIANVFARADLMPKGAFPDGLMFEEQEGLPSWVYQGLAWLAAVTLLTSLAAQRYYLLSRSLKREISRRESLEAELRTLAITDPLSGLANRRHLEDRAAGEIVRSRRHRHDLSLIVLDLDDFKELNDTFGHVFGDRCIKAVADACHSVLRDIDLAARYGGDEFVIMLAETGPQAAEKIADRLRRTVGDLVIKPSTAPLSASIGVALLTDGDRTIDDVIARADAEMYREKKRRRSD
jgi:diguanylate cyclase (GGDEF)-like protein